MLGLNLCISGDQKCDLAPPPQERCDLKKGHTVIVQDEQIYISTYSKFYTVCFFREIFRIYLVMEQIARFRQQLNILF